MKIVSVKLRDIDVEFINTISKRYRKTRSSVIRGALAFCFADFEKCFEFIKSEIDIPRRRLL